MDLVKQLSSVIPAQFVILEQLSSLTELVHREWSSGLLWMWQSLSTKVWPDRFDGNPKLKLYNDYQTITYRLAMCLDKIVMKNLWQSPSWLMVHTDLTLRLSKHFVRVTRKLTLNLYTECDHKLWLSQFTSWYVSEYLK